MRTGPDRTGQDRTGTHFCTLAVPRGVNGPFDEDDDPWPDEPDEFDPEADGPQVDVPEGPRAPEPPDFSDADIPADVANAFWSVVVLTNVGLLGVSVGLMFVGFQGRLRLGGFLVGVGVLSLLFAYRRYRAYRTRTSDDDHDREA